MSKTPPLFELGAIVATPAALRAMNLANMAPATLLHKHVTGDWTELSAHDLLLNQRATTDGTRVFSSYTLSTGTRLWVITEADRSSTLFLLPTEY
jgi:hypothetical protein